jgi:hypothetical protein
VAKITSRPRASVVTTRARPVRIIVSESDFLPCCTISSPRLKRRLKTAADTASACWAVSIEKSGTRRMSSRLDTIVDINQSFFAYPPGHRKVLRSTHGVARNPHGDSLQSRHLESMTWQ